jgi:glutamate/tyrosine decarboxylase-like PLP-dependent enzyme
MGIVEESCGCFVGGGGGVVCVGGVYMLDKWLQEGE